MKRILVNRGGALVLADYAVISQLLFGTDERGYALKDLVVHVVLRSARGFELGLPDLQRMVAAVDDEQRVVRGHPLANALEPAQRAEGITGSLYKKDVRPQRHQHLVTHRAAGPHQRIAETDQAVHQFLGRDMAADP